LPADGAPPPRTPRTVASRLTAILLTFRSGSSHSLTEIAGLTGLPMSTVHRLAAEMASWQLLTRAADGRYEIGPNLQQLAGDVGYGPDLDERAALVVTDLCEATHRRARLGILRGGAVAYVEKRVGPEPATPFRPGATLPAHATALGKALLAFTPRGNLAPLRRRSSVFTAQTRTAEQLDRELRVIRLTRFALARGELVRGEFAVAAPVFGPGGSAVAALELQVADLRGDLERCRPALLVAAGALSRELSLDPRSDDRPRLRVLSGSSGVDESPESEWRDPAPVLRGFSRGT
jgi:DNA-binding IclR family transcriptional regulator